MNEYKNKSFEELRFEDTKVLAGAGAAVASDIPRWTTSATNEGEKANTSKESRDQCGGFAKGLETVGVGEIGRRAPAFSTKVKQHETSYKVNNAATMKQEQLNKCDSNGDSNSNVEIANQIANGNKKCAQDLFKAIQTDDIQLLKLLVAQFKVEDDDDEDDSSYDDVDNDDDGDASDDDEEYDEDGQENRDQRNKEKEIRARLNSFSNLLVTEKQKRTNRNALHLAALNGGAHWFHFFRKYVSEKQENESTTLYPLPTLQKGEYEVLTKYVIYNIYIRLTKNWPR
jgi:hypothetical protein